MEVSSTRKLCQHLVASAVQRCRVSENLCRLSVTLKSSSDSPTVQISVSDTGAGSRLVEFRNLKYSPQSRGFVHQWDGVLSIKTTGIDDKAINIYSLDLKETIAETRLKRLRALPKKGSKFSGTEVSFFANVNMEEITSWFTKFCQKMLILGIPKLVLEVVVELANDSRSKSEHLICPSEDILHLPSVPRVELLISGFQDYVLKHKFALGDQSGACSLSRENIMIGSGVAANLESLRSTGQTVEAVISIMEVSKTSNPTYLSWFGNKTEVLYFQDFTPCSIPLTCLDVLTSTDWKKYNLSLKTSTMDEDSCVLLEWENIPQFSHVDIILHCYNKKVLITQANGFQVDRNLVKKAVKFALDDLKTKYTGFFLSQHALKIQRYAPDLSRSIAGLILTSDDREFQEECLSILGLQPHDIAKEGKVESRITEKITKIIEMEDLRPKNGRESTSLLFEENYIHEDEDYHDVENDECESEMIL